MWPFKAIGCLWLELWLHFSFNRVVIFLVAFLGFGIVHKLLHELLGIILVLTGKGIVGSVIMVQMILGTITIPTDSPLQSIMRGRSNRATPHRARIDVDRGGGAAVDNLSSYNGLL